MDFMIDDVVQSFQDEDFTTEYEETPDGKCN